YNGQPIGECWLQEMNLARIRCTYPAQDCRRIDLMIGEKALWGQGLGTEIIGLLCHFAFTQVGVDAVFGCDIADYNPRSLRAFQRNGFSIVNTLPQPPGDKARFCYDVRRTAEEAEEHTVDDRIEFWKQEEQAPFAGWDFSYLDGRMLEEDVPWSYETRAQELMRQVTALLDMDTGGGERLLEMRSAWPDRVVATEAYPPNLKLARERLAPLEVTVLDVDVSNELAMPFADGEFGLILNRHSAFNSHEIARVLAPGGHFLTQQVHGLYAHDLLDAFGVAPLWPDAKPEFYLPLLQAAGLEIVMSEDWTGKLTFTDVGALVYYLKAVPWTVPGFSVATHLDQLLALQQRLEREGALVFAAKKYIIDARKPL
ncbi:MAG: GNAT family N-acetyltransferase, partial [Caldilineaceae bacterium]|nr:GNAT family N-acetyltransferase [Caldilineaceae bacterium]